MTYPLVPFSEFLRLRSDFVTIDDFASYKRLRVKLHGRGIVLRDEIEGSDIRTKKQQIVRRGDFLVAEIDAKVGGVGIVPDGMDGGIVSSHYFLFEIDQAKCLRGWLDAFIRSGQLEEQVTARGSTNYAAIRPETVLGFQLPLPPAPEQMRIVVRIEELAGKIEEATGLQNEATSELSRLLLSAVDSVFVNGRAAGWVETPLGSIVVEANYGTSERTDDDDTGVPILRMGNIQDGRIDSSQLRYLSLSTADRARYLLQEGDILVNRTNSAELVGKCAVFEIEGDFAFASYLIRLSLDQSRAVPHFVAHFINSPVGRAFMFKERKQMTGQANINGTTLKTLSIPLPPTTDEQQVALRYLESLRTDVDRIRKDENRVADEFEAMLPAILSKAFAGEL